MDGKRFIERLDNTDGLEFVGVTDDDCVVIKTRGGTLALHRDVILERDEEEIFAVLEGKREPQVLKVMTRIVGYFSAVHNWNSSKHAELKDRHKGNYVLPDNPTWSQQTTSPIPPRVEKAEEKRELVAV